MGSWGEKTCASRTFLFLGVPLQTYPHPLWVRNLTVKCRQLLGGNVKMVTVPLTRKKQTKPMVWNVLMATVSSCPNFCLKQRFSSVRLILQKFWSTKPQLFRVTLVCKVGVRTDRQGQMEWHATWPWHIYPPFALDVMVNISSIIYFIHGAFWLAGDVKNPNHQLTTIAGKQPLRR